MEDEARPIIRAVRDFALSVDEEDLLRLVPGDVHDAEAVKAAMAAYGGQIIERANQELGTVLGTAGHVLLLLLDLAAELSGRPSEEILQALALRSAALP